MEAALIKVTLSAGQTTDLVVSPAAIATEIGAQMYAVARPDSHWKAAE